MTWEDYREFERWLNVAQIALDQAKSAVKDEDDNLFRKFVLLTQDALCEAVAAHDKAYKLELDRQRGYCADVEIDNDFATDIAHTEYSVEALYSIFVASNQGARNG